MNDEREAENYDEKRIKRALARLYFSHQLEGSYWLSPAARESIDRTVHYGDQLFVSKSPLTLGGLIDANPNYVADACARVLAAREAVTREEFLASFLELLLTKDRDKMLELSRVTEQLDPARAEKFKEMIESYLVARQIPAEDLYVAFGIYVLQKAHDQGVISMTDKVTCRRESQQLEARV